MLNVTFTPYSSTELRLFNKFIEDLARHREGAEHQAQQIQLGHGVVSGQPVAAAAVKARKSKTTEQPPAEGAPATASVTAETEAETPAAAPTEKAPELTPVEARAAIVAVIGDNEDRRKAVTALLKERYNVESINLLTPEGRAAFVSLVQQEVK